MYLYAWKAGLKTTYYLRSRPATRIQQTTVAGGSTATGATGTRTTTPEALPPLTDQEALACSLENPDNCEACQ